MITGTGAVTGAGASVDATWEAVSSGQTAVAPWEQWDGENWPVKVASEVKESKRDLVSDRKLHKSISQTDLFGINAAEQAIAQSGLLEHREKIEDETEVATFNDRSGIIAGSGGGTYNTNYDFLPLIAETGGDLHEFGSELSTMVSPMWLLRVLPNNVLCHVGIRNQLKGHNACVTNQCIGGLQAVAESVEAIRTDAADRMVAVGT